MANPKDLRKNTELQEIYHNKLIELIEYSGFFDKEFGQIFMGINRAHLVQLKSKKIKLTFMHMATINLIYFLKEQGLFNKYIEIYFMTKTIKDLSFLEYVNFESQKKIKGGYEYKSNSIKYPKIYLVSEDKNFGTKLRGVYKLGGKIVYVFIKNKEENENENSKCK